MSDLEPTMVYFNSRVRGMKSHLMGQTQIESLLDGDLSKLSDLLLDSPYKEEMAESLTRYSGPEAVEDAVSRNLVHTFQNLIKGATGDMKPAVQIFLMRWDLLAAKSLLRCSHHGIRGEAASMWLAPGPTLTLARMTELVEADSMGAVVNGLVAWNRGLCKGLIKALPDYEETKDPVVLEEALDRIYFSDNVKKLESAEDEFSADLRNLLKGEVDRINLRVVFQYLSLQGDKEQALDRILTGGFIPTVTLQEMLNAGTVDGGLEKLSGTRYQSVSAELLEFVKAGQFAALERFFERIISRNIRRISLQNVFGLGVMMDFAWAKYNEVVNLRLIARGLSGDLPKARVQEELFFV